MENPQYVLMPDKRSYFVPRIIMVIFLAVLIYYGIFLNLKFLKINMGVYYSLGAIVISIILAGFAFLETYSKYMKAAYYFYADRMYANNMWHPYVTIPSFEVKRNPLDKIFGTSTIVLGKYKLKYVPYSEQIHNYIRSLVQSSN